MVKQFLTRKQAWRKCKTRHRANTEDWETILQGELFQWDSKLGRLSKIQTWDGISRHSQVRENRSKSCTFGMKFKKVSFDPKVRVQTIPPIHHFGENIREDIWWSHEDYHQFIISAREFNQKHGSLKFFEEIDEDPIMEDTCEMPVSILTQSSCSVESFNLTKGHIFSFIDENVFCGNIRSNSIKRSGSTGSVPIPISASCEHPLKPAHACSWPGDLVDEKHWSTYCPNRSELFDKHHRAIYSTPNGNLLDQSIILGELTHRLEIV